MKQISRGNFYNKRSKYTSLSNLNIEHENIRREIDTGPSESESESEPYRELSFVIKQSENILEEKKN